MNLKDADKTASKLKKILDVDLHAHGTRNQGDKISVNLEYFNIREIIEAYKLLRAHQRKMRKVLRAINNAGDEIKLYDMDEL